AAYQSDGKLVVVGQVESGADFVVVRYNSDGTPDSDFGNDGTVLIDFGEYGATARSVAIDGSDRIVIAGYSYQYTTTGGYDFAVARLTAGGALDTSFDADGKQTIDFGSGYDIGYSVAVDSLDRVLLAGSSFEVGIGTDFAVARLTTGGALDT